MIIKEIELRDFRNYESLNLQFHSKVNIFLGNNAQGKTNLLEGIYISSIGKSFRTQKDSEMVKFNSDFCKIKVSAEKGEEELVVELFIGKEGKGYKVDGVKLKKTAELLENIYCVVFSPEDLKIVKEEPEKRRRFINTELSQLKPSYYINISNYKKALKQRNALLKEIKFKGNLYEFQEDMLEIWDDKLAEYGSKIIHQRMEFIIKLNKISKELHMNITNGSEELKIKYESNVKIEKNMEDQKKNFKKALKESIKSDLRNGTTGKGPHKDDICLEVNGIDIRRFGSQGQQRTAALSLKLAELKLIKEETNEEAILLLDDVMSELDGQRQNFLINSLHDVQLFITTTEISEEVKNALPDGKTFYVENGNIKEY